jgi:hypothetical protein
MSKGSAYLLLFVSGAIIGTAYDFIHLIFSVTAYAHPYFWGQTIWTFPEFGMVGVVGFAGVMALKSHLSAPGVSGKRVLLDAVFLLVAYLTTGILNGRDLLVVLILAAISAIRLILLWRRGAFRLELIVSVLICVLGPIVEIALVQVGFFHYQLSDLIPPWLPLLYFISGPLIVNGSLLVESRRASVL